MPECPSAMEIALFADGQMADAAAIALRAHAAHCPSCAEAILNMMQVNDLSMDGHLPVLDASEHAEAVQRIEDGWKDPGGDDIQSEDDRNDEAAASLSLEDIEGPDENEENPMDSNSDPEEMQNSIKSVFLPGMVSAPDVIGFQNIPGYGMPGILQAYSDTCAIRSQELVLRDFGIHVTQDQLVGEARQNGWYVPGLGTPDDALGKLIEAHGIPVQRYEQANIFNLVSELAQGHRVILSVDSGELWNTNDILKPVFELNEELWEDNLPDHAVIVSGVDVSDAQNPVVIVTDPGTGEIAARYALVDFLEAWEDSGFSMLATAAAPSEFQMDHIAYIGNLDYDHFAQWYPSVEHMGADVPGFVGLCADFDRMVMDPAFHQQHNLLGILSSHIPEPWQDLAENILPAFQDSDDSEADDDDSQNDDDFDRA